MASPFASPFAPAAPPTSVAPAANVSPFAPQASPFGASPFGAPIPQHQGALLPPTISEPAAEDVQDGYDDIASTAIQALLMSGPSTIARDYPVTLPPRRSCNLNLTSGDVIATDEILGQGAWGDVCKGLYDGKDVAVKYIHWNGEPSELRSLQHELTVLSRLKHPNILTMYGGSVRPDPEIFLVQELMAGSVSDIMYGKNGRQCRKLTLKESLQIGHDVIKGLCYLHQYNVIHRDIKPDNTLLTWDGMAKIGDFGLARFKINTVLQTRTLDMGTAAYMAPECFDPDLGGVTVAVDIYSFGVTVWELIMGERPYKEYQRDQAIVWQVLQRLRPHLPEPSDAFPPQVMLLIQRCWAQNPKDRPTAVEVEAELGAIIQEGATFDPESPLIAQVKDNMNVNKGGVAAAAANLNKLSVVQE